MQDTPSLDRLSQSVLSLVRVRASPRTRREWAVRLPNLTRSVVYITRSVVLHSELFGYGFFGAMVQQQGSAYGILRGLSERRRVDVGHGTSASVR